MEQLLTIKSNAPVKPVTLTPSAVDKLRDLLTAERSALNILCRLSGIATATRAWADAHNADLKAAADRRPLTTTRIISDLQDRLDKADPVLAAELRANRGRYEALARSLVR